MGVEIAKVSLWLGSFVPGLSLAYLDFNVQRGNSLIGVTRAEEVGEGTLFGDAQPAIATAKGCEAMTITTGPVEASRTASQALHDTVAGAQQLFNLWTAEPLVCRVRAAKRSCTAPTCWQEPGLRWLQKPRLCRP